MRMREIIDIIGTSFAHPVTEATDVQYVSDRDDDIEVLLNPTLRELYQIAENDEHNSVRVMRFGTTVYAFQASLSTHDYIAISLELPYKKWYESDLFELEGGKLVSYQRQTDIRQWVGKTEVKAAQ